jgi:flagellar hook-basal body complex protein FliE
MASPTVAANAYASLARITDPSGLKGSTGEGGPSFGDMVKQAVGSVVQSSQQSDAQAKAMVAGKANMIDVVTAVAETEVAVDTLVSVRDRVIAAYEEIMKMPI